MEFIRIQSAQNSHTQALLQLYTEAFPESQRRSEAALKKIMESNDKFHCNAVLMNDELVGFFNYWDFDTFFFVEHIAIEPPLRGHKLGEKIITLARKSANRPLVLEAETAEDSDWGERRIEFYRRLGFEIIPYPYEQPPYEKDGEYITLHLMSDNASFGTAHFELIKTTIYREVYNV